MQSKDELENWYSRPDPWGYEHHEDDFNRKQAILEVLDGMKFQRALDIGCGEGWITKDLPAEEIHGIELSDNASLRLPPNVKRVSEPQGKYDLIIATGVMYEHYDYKKFIEWIKNHCSDTAVLCNIKEWEVPIDIPNQIIDVEFPYRSFTQKLRAYDFTS